MLELPVTGLGWMDLVVLWVVTLLLTAGYSWLASDWTSFRTMAFGGGALVALAGRALLGRWMDPTPQVANTRKAGGPAKPSA